MVNFPRFSDEEPHYSSDLSARTEYSHSETIIQALEFKGQVEYLQYSRKSYNYRLHFTCIAALKFGKSA